MVEEENELQLGEVTWVVSRSPCRGDISTQRVDERGTVDQSDLISSCSTQINQSISYQSEDNT